MSGDSPVHGPEVVLPDFWYRKLVCNCCLVSVRYWVSCISFHWLEKTVPWNSHGHSGQPVETGDWKARWMDRLMASFLLLARLSSPVTP